MNCDMTVTYSMCKAGLTKHNLSQVMAHILHFEAIGWFFAILWHRDITGHLIRTLVCMMTTTNNKINYFTPCTCTQGNHRILLIIPATSTNHKNSKIRQMKAIALNFSCIYILVCKCTATVTPIPETWKYTGEQVVHYSNSIIERDGEYLNLLWLKHFPGVGGDVESWPL